VSYLITLAKGGFGAFSMTTTVCDDWCVTEEEMMKILKESDCVVVCLTKLEEGTVTAAATADHSLRESEPKKEVCPSPAADKPLSRLEQAREKWGAARREAWAARDREQEALDEYDKVGQEEGREAKIP